MSTSEQFDPPQHSKDSFHCPRCGVWAHQHWSTVFATPGPHQPTQELNFITLSFCQRCNEAGVWVLNRLLYPQSGQAPLPHPAFPDAIKQDYDEAREIVARSPRGAAALLRLCIQKLCQELGEKSENLNHDIGELVKKGLPARVQEALDTVRVVGNNAVHPGQIDLDDNDEIAQVLFKLVNFIVEKMISEPKEIEDIYGSLPPGARENIAKRDGDK